jgi:cellulose synthase/poly-beta-1,6-N-acetylglucosamine synthase-like glycosyltransferase
LLILLNFLSAIFLLVYVALIITFISGWLRLKESDRISVTGLLKVSVLIAARNEEACILNCLNDILAQQYPPHLIEIIVVDDHSTDLTSETILSLRSGQIKLIRLKQSNFRQANLLLPLMQIAVWVMTGFHLLFLSMSRIQVS